MSTRSIVIEQIKEIASTQGRKLQPLTDDLVLVNSGLDSLCFAILVARLEDILGRDPFTESEDTSFPVTLREFVDFYELEKV